ncbi:phosphoadenylyl-sulfate reductase [Cognatishimia sp. MH4019]|uniref:phosphoadenylyl-sulfate reductase n=1 Tax=Cognatishimia sp. MH4019 TaxID=2854030 RepID=UPI001CD6D9C9|nr:phosphoadenylyl-sulfate reductase [Cognatishimia sp. MH4019]
MPHNLPIHARIAALNGYYRHNAGIDVLSGAITNPKAGQLTLVSSFGAESVVLLHMVSVVNPRLPVLFIDTEMLFPETLAYQTDVATHLGLQDVRTIRAADIAAQDPNGTLHQSNPDACCALRKTAPLEKALLPFDGWITGRKRFQAGSRASLEFFEADGPARIKVNPLAHWTPEDVQDYIINNRLPRHPLVAQGYPSIGCAPCTSPVRKGEDPRSGRWRNTEKEECGIHIVDGKIVRRPAA